MKKKNYYSCLEEKVLQETFDERKVPEYKCEFDLDVYIAILEAMRKMRNIEI